MKKRTTITTEKREVWIVTEGVGAETVVDTESPVHPEETAEINEALITTSPDLTKQP